MVDTLKEYLEHELLSVASATYREDDLKYKSDICWYARQRALGACDFAQMLGVPYETVMPLFNNHCKELERLEYNYAV